MNGVNCGDGGFGVGGDGAACIVLVTGGWLPKPDVETPLLVRALHQLGVAASVRRWDEPFGWAAAPLVVVRTPWDYFGRRGEFVAWAHHVGRLTRLVNPAGVLEWNSHKSYLLDLARGSQHGPDDPRARHSMIGVSHPQVARVRHTPAKGPGGTQQPAVEETRQMTHPESAIQPAARRALVTGGSRGVGAAVAAALAAAGHAVAVHCRAGTAAAESVVAALPGSGHAVVAGDVADPEQVRAFVAAAVAALGGIDVLVNNAGVYFEQPISATSYAEWQDAWRRIIDINLHGVANVTWCVTDHLLHRPEGPAGARIITVGSRGAYRGEPTAPAYGASKAAVHSLTQSLAVALAPHGIAAAAVAPGFVRTDMTEALLAAEGGGAIRAQSPFGRVAEPGEIAAAVAWLAAPDAQWASGAVLDLNGASHLR